MGDSYNDPHQNGRNFHGSRDGGRGGFRGGRGGPGNREGGGFRIRLSENEMRSARTIQEAFNLRSTVAVLGFAVRTLGEMLEQGKLNDFIAEYQSQGPQGNNQRPSNTKDNRQERNSNTHKANPFARPPKPEAQNEENKSQDNNDESTGEESSSSTPEIKQIDQQETANTEVINNENNPTQEDKPNATSES